MSAATLAVLERVKERFASGVKPAHITDDDISQYNITIDGKVVKTVVFNLKDFTYSEVANSIADIEITLDEEYVLPAFKGLQTLVELLAAGKIQVKGNTELLVKLDERSKRVAAAAAAAKPQQ